eukprot:gene13514-7702_t
MPPRRKATRGAQQPHGSGEGGALPAAAPPGAAGSAGGTPGEPDKEVMEMLRAAEQACDSGRLRLRALGAAGSTQGLSEDRRLARFLWPASTPWPA